MYAPKRWQTSDGCVPVRVVWAYFNALGIARARTAMDTARGIGLAFGSEETGIQAWNGVLDDAFPDGVGDR